MYAIAAFQRMVMNSHFFIDPLVSLPSVVIEKYVIHLTLIQFILMGL
jgi:hypothetical protein